MNQLIPIGQISEDSAETQELVEEEGATIPEPVTDAPVFYLHKMFSQPKSSWEMLTGLSFDTATPEQIAEAFKQVVRKKAQRTADRVDFGSWQAKNVAPPTVQQQEQADGLLGSNNFVIDTGAIFEGVADDDTSLMHVDYFVLVDPAAVRAGEPPIPGDGDIIGRGEVFTDNMKVAGVLGLVVGGVLTASLVKKGVGLKILAGTAGGIITAGAFMSGAQALDRGKRA